MYKADIIKVLWNKKCYKDARRQKKIYKENERKEQSLSKWKIRKSLMREDGRDDI